MTYKVVVNLARNEHAKKISKSFLSEKFVDALQNLGGESIEMSVTKRKITLSADKEDFVKLTEKGMFDNTLVEAFKAVSEDMAEYDSKHKSFGKKLLEGMANRDNRFGPWASFSSGIKDVPGAKVTLQRFGPAK